MSKALDTASGRIATQGFDPAPFAHILTDDALAFLAAMHKRFDGRRKELLAARKVRQAALDAGGKLDFLPETKAIREGDWKVAPVPADLQDRRVEITGPADRKMLINALNSGAKLFMACLEDASSPTALNVMQSQVNLYDAVHRQIDYTDPTSGKHYALKDEIAVLKVRPRGWHLPEKHILVDGEPMSGALVDFGLYFFHNARQQLANGSGPYFYLPKLESHKEAALWNDVFVFAQDHIGIDQGTIRATVLIETLPAAFETEEILHALKDHIDGLNCGRWDYIFSYIKCNRKNADAVLPDRAAVTMTVPFMRAYCLQVIKTCHKRGAFAIGGMAAQIPVRGDEAANEAAFAKVRADKEREAKDGHDGTWVAHPGLVPVAMEVFDSIMPEPNQVARQRDDVEVTAEELTTACDGPKTLEGLKMNVNVGIGYLAAWLRGQGAVPLHNLMEDAATAEISRTQLWQWRVTGTKLDSGELVDAALIEQAFADELAALEAQHGKDGLKEGRYDDAAALMKELVLADELVDFLTLPAYDRFF